MASHNVSVDEISALATEKVVEEFSQKYLSEDSIVESKSPNFSFNFVSYFLQAFGYGSSQISFSPSCVSGTSIEPRVFVMMEKNWYVGTSLEIWLNMKLLWVALPEKWLFSKNRSFIQR